MNTNMIITDLQNRGFVYFFNIKEECIYCNDYTIGFEEFDVIEFHSIRNILTGLYDFIYGVKCDKYHIKGMITYLLNLNPHECAITCFDEIINNEKNKFKYYSNN